MLLHRQFRRRHHHHHYLEGPPRIALILEEYHLQRIRRRLSIHLDGFFQPNGPPAFSVAWMTSETVDTTNHASIDDLIFHIAMELIINVVNFFFDDRLPDVFMPVHNLR